MKILVLNAFGLHLGYLGCYGNDWIATPNIDRLAADSVVFDQHYVDVPILAESSRSEVWLASARQSLAELNGSDMVGIDGPSLAAPWTMPEDLLTSYTEDDEIDPWPDPPTGELTDDDSILRIQDTYAAAITWYDAQLGHLLDDIDAKPWGDDLLLVFTASSGYPLGEHGWLGCEDAALHEELVHVPLLVRCPGRRFAGDRIAALTQPDDVAAALRDWSTGIGALIHGTVDSLRPHAITRWRSAAAIRTPDWALIKMNDSRHLYVKPDDRWEVNDLAEREYERADELDRMLSSPAAAEQPGC